MVDWIVKLAVFVLGVWGATWLAQDYLVFLPRFARAPVAMPERAQPIELVTADGVRLRGWWMPPRMPIDAGGKAPVVIYFGGNADNVSWTLADERWPGDWALAGFNYRGYGESEGSPGERALIADALAIRDLIGGREDVDSERIVAFGRSLGSGVAVALAAARPLGGVLLASPFDSLVAVGRRHYPYLPVSLLLRHRFDSAALAPRLSVPMHAIVAQDDTIIPPERSRSLYDAWAGPKSWQVVEHADHNTLSEPAEYWAGVAGFLERVGPLIE